MIDKQIIFSVSFIILIFIIMASYAILTTKLTSRIYKYSTATPEKIIVSTAIVFTIIIFYMNSILGLAIMFYPYSAEATITAAYIEAGWQIIANSNTLISAVITGLAGFFLGRQGNAIPAASVGQPKPIEANTEATLTSELAALKEKLSQHNTQS